MERFTETVKNIVKNIPHKDLVIQWDLCFEMTALEVDRGRFDSDRHQAYFASPVLPGLVDRVAQLCADIPDDIGLAFYLCYGDLGHKHFVEP